MNLPSRPPATPLSEALTGEHRFQLLIDAIKDYAIYLLDSKGYINSWNTGAERLKGYTAHEILGQHFSRFYTEEDRQRGEPVRALHTALTEGKYENEAQRVRKDGSLFWASVVIDPLYDAAGKHIGFAKITRDITERKRAQDEMDRARDALAQAPKLEAIGRLTGGVAHDFNNLLTIIRSSAELLRRAGDDTQRRARYIQAIADTADRAALLTRQLLAFARQQPLRPEVFRVEQRVQAMTEMMTTTLGPSVQVQLDFPASLGLVEADANQFDTALLNMVINAKDAMPEGGHLRISACDVGQVPSVRRHAAARGEFVAISMEDTGSGIEAGALARIFEPFFTTKPMNKGTGLGLSQVYGFAKQSGGEIDVSSRVGEGTRFTLYLPRTSKAQPSAAAADIARGPKAAQALSILLVEDNNDVGQFTLGVLREMGHAAMRAANGEEALELLQLQRERIDLVFSDVVMPGMNGVELARAVRARWPDLPVVLTSGYSHVLAADAPLDFELLQKPYSVQELDALFERTMRQAAKSEG